MLQLRSLRHLAQLAQRLNYARAAEDLGLSQSALSRSIQALEAQLGMRLLDRDRAGVALTTHGQSVVDRARVLLAEADEMEHQLVREAEGSVGRVRFGIAPMPARALLPAVLAARIAAAPDVTNDVVVRDVDALWALLLDGELDFFVAQDGLVADAGQARIELLGLFPLSVIVRAGHPLLADGAAETRYPIVRSSRYGLPLPASVAAHANGPPNILEDFATLAAVTAATDAIWFTSRYAAIDDIRAGRLCELPQAVPLAPGDVRIVLYSLARRSQSTLVRDLKTAFRVAYRELAGGSG
jgi:DNA-binding transcriptional LysR family regulator